MALDRYEAEYDVLPELELELPTSKCKPDVAIYARIGNDWFNDRLIVPMLHLVQILLPNGTQLTYPNGLLNEPILGLEVK